MELRDAAQIQSGGIEAESSALHVCFLTFHVLNKDASSVLHMELYKRVNMPLSATSYSSFKMSFCLPVNIIIWEPKQAF